VLVFPVELRTSAEIKGLHLNLIYGHLRKTWGCFLTAPVRVAARELILSSPMAFAQPAVLAAHPQLAAGFAQVVQLVNQPRGLAAEIVGAPAQLQAHPVQAADRLSVQQLSAYTRNPNGQVSRHRVASFVNNAAGYNPALHSAVAGVQRGRVADALGSRAGNSAISNARALQAANRLGIPNTVLANRPNVAATLAYIREHAAVRDLFAASTMMNYDPAGRLAPLSVPMGLFASIAGNIHGQANQQTFRDLLQNGTQAAIFAARPHLRNTFDALQHPGTIAEYSIAAANLMRAAHPDVQYRFQLEIGLERTRLGSGEVIYRRLTIPGQGILVRNTSSATSVTQDIVNALLNTVNFENAAGSAFDPAQDRLVVLGLKTVLQGGVLGRLDRLPPAAQMQGVLVPNANIQGDNPALPGLHSVATVRGLLANARIFANFFDVLELDEAERTRFKRLVKVQLPKHITGNCLAKAFIIAADLLPEEGRVAANYRLRADLVGEFMQRLDTDDEWKQLVHSQQEFPALELLRRLFEVFAYDGSIIIAFFSGFGVRPPAPMCRISFAPQADDYPFTFEVPEDEETAIFLDEEPERKIILLYKEHAIVSTIAKYEQEYLKHLASHARVREAVYSGDAKPYKLTPVDCSQFKSPADMPAKRRKHNPEKPRYWASNRMPLGPTHLNNEYWSADYETAVCPECTERFGISKIHGVALGVAWGVDSGICFVGSDCPFQDRPGCTVQFLHWLFDNHHAVRPDSWFMMSEEERADTPSLVLYFFNGANFDHYLLQEGLSAEHIEFSSINQNGKLMNLKFANISVVDFMLVSSGAPTSLDKTYVQYSTSWLADTDPHPATGKWRCFPYKLITNDPVDASSPIIPLDSMREESLWGGKSVVDKASCPDWWNRNVDWWSEAIREDGYHPFHDLVDYCLADCYILQCCVQLYLRHVVVGVVHTPAGDKPFDTHYRSVPISIASSCKEIFCQTGLTKPLEAPNMRAGTPVHLPEAAEPMRLGELLRSAYKGGHTQLYSTCLPAKPPGVDEDEPVADMWDVNSMYPTMMAQKAVPIKFEGISPINLTITSEEQFDLVDSNMYVCGFKYDSAEDSGLMIKVANSCLCPNSCGPYYYDPAVKEYQPSTHFGCEIREALRTGCTIELLYAIEFDSSVLFREFVEEFYRRKSTATNPGEVAFNKGVLNNTYGKFAQSIGPRCVAITPTETMSEIETKGDIIVGFDTAGIRIDPITGEALYGSLLVQLVDPNATGIGDFVAIAACITAQARATLLGLIRQLKRLKNIHGGPIHCYYCDTDSMLIDRPDLTDPETAAFFQQIDGSALGQMKIETADGVIEFIGLAKKVYCITYLDRGVKKYKMAHKGIFKGAITRDVFMETFNGADPPVVSKGGFQHSNAMGVWEVDMPRTLSKGNATRVWMGSDSVPWESVEAFVATRGGVIRDGDFGGQVVDGEFE